MGQIVTFLLIKCGTTYALHVPIIGVAIAFRSHLPPITQCPLVRARPSRNSAVRISEKMFQSKVRATIGFGLMSSFKTIGFSMWGKSVRKNH